MTAARPGTGTGPDAATRWRSWHLHVDSLAPQALETAVLEVLAPAVAGFSTGQAPRPWFFIRYWQRGPHLRLRLADPTEDEAAALATRMATMLAALNASLAPADRITADSYRAAATPIAAIGTRGAPEPVEPLLPGGVHPGTYEPEVDRYGGAELMAASEELFHASSAMVLRACRARPSFGHHIADGMEAMAATLSAWPGDRLVLLRALTDGWTPWLGPATQPVIDRYARLAAANSQALRQLADGAPSRWSPWTRRLAVATNAWIDRHGVPRAARILGSHLHMTQNRLGVGGVHEGLVSAALLRLLAAT